MTLVAEFQILDLPKMTNSLARLHWSAKMKEARKWKGLVFEKCVELRICGLHLEKAQITLTRHSAKEPDFDGVASGFKHILDGLVVAGVLDDDKPSVIGSPTYKWEKAKAGEGRVTIKIEDPLDLDYRAIASDRGLKRTII